CESTHVHHYAPCECGRVAADGGREYLRRRGHPDDFDELSEYEETETLTAVALLARQWPEEAPPASYTYGVEGDLDIDDGRPTNPGEELTVVSEPDWVEDTLVSAADELGRMTGRDHGRSS